MSEVDQGLKERLAHFSKKREHKTAQGLKKFYYCNNDIQTCKICAYVLTNNRTGETEFWISPEEHIHTSAPKSLSEHAKNRFKELHDGVCFIKQS